MRIFIGSKVEELVIHDLRTPLNVIGLALRMLEQQPHGQNTDFAEDLSFIQSGTADLERMLTCLTGTSQLPDALPAHSAERFDPRDVIAEVLEDQRRISNRAVIELIVENDAPGQVSLSRQYAKLALQQALSNTLAAAGRKPSVVRLTGGPDRCILRFESAVPPRATLQPGVIDPDQFERILGTPGERRGLDLAIVAQVSRLFGGSTRLETTAGQGTVIVIDWPATLAQ